jgi:hypothetical protein
MLLQPAYHICLIQDKRKTLLSTREGRPGVQSFCYPVGPAFPFFLQLTQRVRAIRSEELLLHPTTIFHLLMFNEALRHCNIIKYFRQLLLLSVCVERLISPNVINLCNLHFRPNTK